MPPNKPENPQGRHFLLLRTELNLSQTEFGALIGIAQPAVSIWETARRNEPLPSHLAKAFLEIWDLFPTRPRGGYDEMMAVLAAFRRGTSTARAQQMEIPPTGFLELQYPAGSDGPRVLIEDMSQREPGSTEPSPHAPKGKAMPRQRRAGTSMQESSIGGSANEIARFQLSLSTVSWSHARGVSGGETSLWRRRAAVALLGLAASLTMVLVPTGCFRTALRGESVETEQDPIHVPGQVYIDQATDGVGGSEFGAKHSLPMPTKPYSWQKRAPCGQGEVEKVGGCWAIQEGARPPCFEYAVESEDRCLIPLPAKPKKPGTMVPVAP